MPAGTYNIVADAGADYLVTVTYEDTGGTPIDLTGYTASMTFAPQFGSSELLLELTSSSGIVITPLAGQLACTMTHVQTTDLWAASPGGAWMLDIIDSGGVVTRLLQGAYSVNPAAPSGT